MPEGKLTAAQCGHVALCAKCGAWAKSGDPRWMSDFFMPERCESCGDFKSRSSGSAAYRSQWIISFGYYRECEGQPKRSLWRPSTWQRQYERVDFDTGRTLTFPTPEWKRARAALALTEQKP